MPSTDAFVLKNSDLNAFLFADVGTELNGSTLTMLSVLARLNKDPWAEAAKWTKMPKLSAIDSLARSIGEMPLSPGALAETNAIASRLILLLPTRTQNSRPNVRAAVTASTMPNWLPIALLCAFLVIGVAFTMISAPAPLIGVSTPPAHTTDQPSAITSR